ncbi:protein-cysteine S-palmitoyltransferase [Aureococcus anophagefferens]|nr:protein-cysteine S-palmitoyltransferase [Aureococcus anophagefferens]
MPVLVEEEDQTPMLEMAARVGAGAGEITEVPPALGGALDAAERGAAGGDDDDDDRLSLLALEYAVGTGVPSDWDAAEPDAPCGEDCGDGDGRWRAARAAPLRSARGASATSPFWPFTLLVTYPLIFCVSGAVAFAVLPDHAVATRVAWACGVLALVAALSCTACRDPGVLRRHPEKPGAAWRWNDQARTYRPPESVYDEDLGVVVTGFDHGCPWTGTGIGEKNLGAFHCCVSLLCVCIIFDVLLVMKVLP